MRNQYPTRSNLDATGRVLVRRGCLVRFVSGAVARVAVVRLGYFVPDVLPKGARKFSTTTCNEVVVITKG